MEKLCGGRTVQQKVWPNTAVRGDYCKLAIPVPDSENFISTGVRTTQASLFFK